MDMLEEGYFYKLNVTMKHDDKGATKSFDTYVKCVRYDDLLSSITNPLEFIAFFNKIVRKNDIIEISIVDKIEEDEANKIMKEMIASKKILP